jgi:alcohol dehydrogenase class IV
MSQKIVYGIEKIKPLIESKKILLVRDSAYGFLDIKNFFDDIPHVEFSDFTPNPLYEQVVEGVKVFNENKCDIIVAVGGGSTIDVAKCIKLYCRMDSSINYLNQEKVDTRIPLIAVPTTAGTGSESTRHAVIYFEGNKQSISHSSIVPNVAVLESSVLKTLPLYQKKCTMLDALCQAIESWWSVNSTDLSKDYSRQAIIGIRDNWKGYIEDNSDEAAAAIMEASNFAGRAINITATTAAHAMSYKITSLYKLPHGHAVAVCMSEVWKYILEHTQDCNDSRGDEYLKRTLDDIAALVNLEWFEDLLGKLKMTYPVAGNREDELKTLAKSVNPIRLKNNPVNLSADVLKEMYERIVK